MTGAITSTGNATILGSFSSADLLTAVTGETGTGALVFANTPTLITPAIGAATGTSLALTATGTQNIINGSTTLTAATGNEIGYTLAYTTNKLTSGDDTGLLISMTDTASPGTSLGIDYQVATVSKFSVSNAGAGIFAGTLSASNLSGTNTGDNATNTQYSGLAASKQDVLTNSAGLLAALSDETGTSLAVFSNSPIFTDDFDLAAAGVRMTGANGVLTILGLGDGADENLLIDFNTTTNSIDFSSGTLATEFNLGTMDLNTDTIDLTGTGTLNGLDVIDATGEATLEATLDIGGEVVGTGLGSVAISCTDCLNATEIEDIYMLNSGDTSTGNLTVTKADPSFILDTTTATDTDFWLSVTEDAGSDDDDLFQIGDGTTPGTNPFLSIDTTGKVAVGSTLNYKSKLNVAGAVTASGADAVAGIFTDTTLTNGTVSGFQFGNRFLNTVDGATAGTEVGTFIRMTDSTTTLANTVRGLEVQAYSGTNNTGINTGILAYGKTFGIQGITTSEAAGTSVPTAIYAELANSSATSTGNAIRAYSGNATGATLVSIYQDTSAFTGTGLLLNLGNGTGSFASGNFLDLQNVGTSKLKVASTGRVDILSVDADNVIPLYINTEESTVTQSLFAIESDTTGNGQSVDTVKAHFEADGDLFVSLPGTQTTIALCHASAGQANNDEIVDCSGAPSDLAENYGTSDPTIEAGDVVIASGEATELIYEGFKTTKAYIEKSSSKYQNSLVGVISTQPNQLYADNIFSESENPRPVAMVGRVPVKVSTENGAIRTGDYLTSSSIAGIAMKATQPGMVIGQALQSYTADNSAVGKIVVFVRPFYYDAGVMVDANGNVFVQRDTASTTLITETASTAYLMNQKGSGDLLQLQSNGTDRFVIKNNGALNINTFSVRDTDDLVVIKSNDAEIFTINVRGQAAFAGNIIVKDDSFAGSIATDENGVASVIFSYDLGTGKPDVQLTVEGDMPALAQIAGWQKNADGNYTGFKIKSFTPIGNPISVIVHYLVIGKEIGYTTSGTIIDLTASAIIVLPDIISPTPEPTPEPTP